MNQYPLDELYQFEKHLATGFLSVLEPCCANRFHKRDSDIAVSPRIEILTTVGETLNHCKVFSETRWAWDGWQGSLEVMAVTNRSDDSRTDTHLKLLGLVRKELQLFRLFYSWPKLGLPIVLTDVREGGTSETLSDENDLDSSTLTWNLWFNIHNEAWPPNIDL